MNEPRATFARWKFVHDAQLPVTVARDWLNGYQRKVIYVTPEQRANQDEINALKERIRAIDSFMEWAESTNPQRPDLYLAISYGQNAKQFMETYIGALEKIRFE